MPRLAWDNDNIKTEAVPFGGRGRQGLNGTSHCMCLKFFKMQLHSFDLGNVFVTCAWTVFLLCKVFVPQRSVGEAECGRISVWLCGKLLLLPQCWLKPQSQVDTLSVNADSLGENDAVGAAVAAAFRFFVRGMCVRNLWFATATG